MSKVLISREPRVCSSELIAVNWPCADAEEGRLGMGLRCRPKLRKDPAKRALPVTPREPNVFAGA